MDKTNISTAGMGTAFGIDSHSRTTTICALVLETGEMQVRTFRGNPYAEMKAWMAQERFPKPAIGVYEAGCTGFVPARLLSTEDVEVVPIAASKMPTSADSRTRKNDRNDSMRLARHARAGELSRVWVPTEEVEGLRDAVHALEDLKQQQASARQRVLALLCRHGIVWEERTPGGKMKKPWGGDFWKWLRAIDLGNPGSQAALLACIRAAESAGEQYAAMFERVHSLASSCTLAPAIEALQCLKGVGFICAFAFCAGMGDFSRFCSGRKVTSWLGFAPSESSSADSRRLGGISRCGSRLLGTMLTECAWSAVRSRPASSKRCPASVDPHIRERARLLSERLCTRRRLLLERGVAPCKANAATAAELGRFMLFLGQEAQERASAAAA